MWRFWTFRREANESSREKEGEEGDEGYEEGQDAGRKKTAGSLKQREHSSSYNRTYVRRSDLTFRSSPAFETLSTLQYKL